MSLRKQTKSGEAAEPKESLFKTQIHSVTKNAEILCLKIKNAEVCFEVNLKHVSQKERAEKTKEKKSWRLICVRSKKIFTG